jgi:hypothetical protein
VASSSHQKSGALHHRWSIPASHWCQACVVTDDFWCQQMLLFKFTVNWTGKCVDLCDLILVIFHCNDCMWFVVLFSVVLRTRCTGLSRKQKSSHLLEVSRITYLSYCIEWDLWLMQSVQHYFSVFNFISPVNFHFFDFTLSSVLYSL